MRGNEAPSPAHIVIVDDDATVRHILREAVVLAGYTCSACENAEQALAYLRQHEVDVVVTDINMPLMDGIELCERVVSHHNADVIVMTGMAVKYTYEQIIAHGASDFVLKPITSTEFIARLRRVLSERATMRERDRALADLQTSLNALRRSMDGVVQAMSLAVEMRDPYTAGHQRRVAGLACSIAEGIGLSEEAVYGLRVAGTIHDVGKIAVPSEILTKPGELTELEYALIQTHVQAGYDILKKIEFPWPVATIVYQHHERLDGSGYPCGLHGEAILLEARVLAVADVLETIASHRPYRAAKGLGLAVEEISENSGTLYDSQVVQVVTALLEQGRLSNHLPSKFSDR